MKKSRPSTGRARQFEELFSACYPRVLGYAIRRTDDLATAEDATSETFLIAWRRFDAVPADALPWVLGVTRKVLANQRRAAGRRTLDGPQVPLDAVGDPDHRTAVADLVADRQAFAAAFASLRPADREALALVNWDGLTPREAATVLDCPPATFYLRLHRARRRLLKELELRGHSFGERVAGPVTSRVADPTEAR